MFDVKIDEGYIVQQSGTSEGTQIKYKKDNYWYKLDNKGSEGLCEYLASKLLTFTDLKPSEYIIYEQGHINGRYGCRSLDYLDEKDEFVTIYRLYYNEFGKNLAKVCSGFDTMEERIRYVVKYVLESTNVDISDYLRKIITLDYLILNEDRHFNNLALICGDNGFKCAPIFDNGMSLLTANQSVNWNFGIEENVKRVVARQFSGSHKKMFEYFGKGFELDSNSALKWLQAEPQSIERDVLIYQLNNCSI